jgi:hypothetical protein
MKSLLALILCLVLVAISGSALAGGYRMPYVATDKEELYGTWVNMDFAGIGRRPQKMIIYPDGRIEYFRSAAVERVSHKVRYLITRKWSDPEGNIWYKSHWVHSAGVECFELIKISNSGKTYESAYDTHEYPTKIDPAEDDYYRIYYRE